MLKKMMLLAVAVAAIAAFAIPAAASAEMTHWTDDHEIVGDDVNITAPFEGKLEFDVGPGLSFGCIVTVKVTVTGPTKAEITEFNVTTDTCTGTSILEPCKLTHDTTNLPWTVTNNATNLTVTKSGGDVTIFNEYAPGCPLGPSSHLLFPSITVTPDLDNEGTITHLTVAGVAKNGAVATGSVTPEDDETTLGLATVEA